MILLNNIQQDVERSIENALYQVLLFNGLTPDRDLYASNSKAYANAKASILTAKGLCVELYGHGSPADRDNKTVPRIVVTGLGFLMGETGNDFSAYHQMGVNQKYSLMKPAAMFSNYRFEVTICSNKTSDDRILEAVRQSAIPNMSYVNFYTPSDPSNFLVRYAYTKQNPDLSYGLIEKSYVYEAVDLVEQLPQEIKSNISPIKEITVDDDDSDLIIYQQSVVKIIDEGETIEESKNTILN